MLELTSVPRKPTPVQARTSASLVQRCGDHGCPPTGCGSHEEDETLSRSARGVPARSMDSARSVTQTPGRALPGELSRAMSMRLGHDFSHVRVHDDAQAAGSADYYASDAYTFGSHIVFGASQYRPGSESGQRLLIHELTHVVQAHNGQSTATGVSSPSDASEQEASRVAAMGGISHDFSTVRLHTGSLGQTLLQRQAVCPIEPIHDECKAASAKCMTVGAACKSKFPTPADIDNAVANGKAGVSSSGFGPNAQRNFLHWLDNTGSELVMPTDIFDKHSGTKEARLRHRDKFIDGVQKRLQDGRMVAGKMSDQIVFAGHANAFSMFSAHSDDLAFSVGGFRLCSKVRATATQTSPGKFTVVFNEWIDQAFDCYNWDPGKGIGIAGLDDTTMCCIENAGKAKHFEDRTDPWPCTDPDALKGFEVSTAAPGTKAPDAGPSAPGATGPDAGATPPPASSSDGDRR